MASRHQSGENIAGIPQLAGSTIFWVAQKKDLHRKSFLGSPAMLHAPLEFFTLYSNQCKLAVHFSYAHGCHIKLTFSLLNSE